MKFAEQIERLQYLDQLIRKQNTGSPAELAGRLDISRSQLYNLIGYLNDIGMEIRFSRMRNSFYYECPDKDLEILFSIKIITDQKANIIYGGGFCFSTSMKTKLIGYDQAHY
jgi:biotin operon repressor